MFKLGKFIFKWALRLVILAVVMVVVFFLSLDSILRVWVEHNMRARTGMDVEIGRFSLGLAEPTVTIQDFKLFNPPSFGGTPFLDIPEIHVEYDRAALARHEIHVTLLRFNLGELDIVKNEAGQTNLFSIAALPSVKKTSGGGGGKNFAKESGFEFTGIDVLNVSVGTAKYIDLKDSKNNREQKIGIENCVMKNVKTPTDLAGLAALVALRGGDFFGSLAGQNNSGVNILNLIGK
jgi:hypothetical protein